MFAQLWNVANMARVECPPKVALLLPFRPGGGCKHHQGCHNTGGFLWEGLTPEDFFGKI